MCIAALAVTPSLALIFAPLFEGGTGLSADNEVNEGVVTAILMPAMVLGLRSILDIQVIDFAPALLAGGVVAVVCGLVALWRTGSPMKVTTLVFLAVVFFGYGYGAAVETNALIRPAKPQFARVEVAGREAAGTRDSSYYLTLAPPRYPGVPERVEVGERFYRANAEGSEVCLLIYRGAFGWRFWEIDFCPA